jgi:hypothetical protein
MKVPHWCKPAFWGLVIGAVGIMILGFAWGGGSWAVPRSAWRKSGPTVWRFPFWPRYVSITLWRSRTSWQSSVALHGGSRRLSKRAVGPPFRGAVQRTRRWPKRVSQGSRNTHPSLLASAECRHTKSPGTSGASSFLSLVSSPPLPLETLYLPIALRAGLISTSTLPLCPRPGTEVAQDIAVLAEFRAGEAEGGGRRLLAGRGGRRGGAAPDDLSR